MKDYRLCFMTDNHLRERGKPQPPRLNQLPGIEVGKSRQGAAQNNFEMDGTLLYLDCGEDRWATQSSHQIELVYPEKILLVLNFKTNGRLCFSFAFLHCLNILLGESQMDAYRLQGFIEYSITF